MEKVVLTQQVQEEWEYKRFKANQNNIISELRGKQRGRRRRNDTNKKVNQFKTDFGAFLIQIFLLQTDDDLNLKNNNFQAKRKRMETKENEGKVEIWISNDDALWLIF